MPATILADITMRRFGWIEVNGKRRNVDRIAHRTTRCIVAAFKARGLSAALKR